MSRAGKGDVAVVTEELRASVGLGLPVSLPAARRSAMGQPGRDWAEHVEDLGFAAITAVDRIAYPALAPLVVLAGAAGSTRRIEVMTNILLAAARPRALVERDVATLAWLAPGRLTLGVAVGGRADDYAAAGADFFRRGAALDATLGELRAPGGAWRSIPLLVGGSSAAALRRAADWGEGWTAGVAGVEEVGEGCRRLHRLWTERGRSGAPRVVASRYVALTAPDEGRRVLGDYYGFLGPAAAPLVDGCLTTENDVRAEVLALREAGADLVVLECTTTSPRELDRIATALD